MSDPMKHVAVSCVIAVTTLALARIMHSDLVLSLALTAIFVMAIGAMKETFKNEKVNTIDGVKVDFESAREWVHLRRSNTEPIIRVYSEAPTAERAEALGNEVVALAKKIIG